MAKTVKIVRLMTNQTLISEIAEIAAVVPGEPDCKLVNPFTIKEDQTLEPWLLNVTKDEVYESWDNESILELRSDKEEDMNYSLMSVFGKLQSYKIIDTVKVFKFI